MSDRNELTLRFRGEYGRLCALVAAALHQGHAQRQVVEAACGRGQDIAPVYVELRKQRKKVNATLAFAKTAGATDQDLVEFARSTRNVLEAEWQRRIPMMA